ncbi:putative alcohol dehydrogenase [Diplodia seriata]|uniref:Putative alcohol dehydrogenase n=1 Tax=Diplodia seriata TaxID=420778 RepID=A0A0G2DSX5_9PEZI|nr:putative alcohol dehydrogenase [Diplodia seriata]
MPTAIAIRKVDGKPGSVYYPLDKLSLPPQTPTTPTAVTVRVAAAALNHRDLFIRQHLYPGTTFGVPLLADGVGVVTAAGSSPSASRWVGKRVVLNPGTGWAKDPAGPESPKGYAILGGTKANPNGGVIVSYGMTLGPKMPFLMSAVLKNIEVKGSTMGSRLEFKQMVEFVNEKKLKPVVSRVVSGIDNIEAIDGLFEDMKKGSQFGKLVIEIAKEGESSKL